MKRINIILCVLSIAAVAGAAVTAVQWRSYWSRSGDCQAEEVQTLSEDEADAYILPDGETVYAHGEWGRGSAGMPGSGVVSENPICGFRGGAAVQTAHTEKGYYSTVPNKKIRKVIVGKYARLSSRDTDMVEDWVKKFAAEGYNGDALSNLKSCYPNLEEIEIEPGNPYLKNKDGILYSIDDRLAEPPYFH